MSVPPCIIKLSTKGHQMLVMETELYDLMAKVEATPDHEENDQRIERIGHILTMLEVFYWEDYKRIVIAKFNVPADHFED